MEISSLIPSKETPEQVSSRPAITFRMRRQDRAAPHAWLLQAGRYLAQSLYDQHEGR
jgi:hypothetical protein